MCRVSSCAVFIFIYNHSSSSSITSYVHIVIVSGNLIHLADSSKGLIPVQFIKG